MIVAEKSPSLRFWQALEAEGLASLLAETPGTPLSRPQLEALVRPQNLLLTAQLANQRRLSLWGTDTSYCQWTRAEAIGRTLKAPSLATWAELHAWVQLHPQALGPAPDQVIALAAAADVPLADAARALAGLGLKALAPTVLPDDADERWHVSLVVLAEAGLSLSVAVPVRGDDTARLVERLYQVRRWQANRPCFDAVIPVPAAVDPFATTAMTLTGISLLQAVALCRLILDNVAHVTVAWPRFGVKLAQIALSCGADDWLGTDDAAADDASGPMHDDLAVELITAAGLTPLLRGAAFLTRRNA